jgi:hypothetical protein
MDSNYYYLEIIGISICIANYYLDSNKIVNWCFKNKIDTSNDILYSQLAPNLYIVNHLYFYLF